MELKNTSGIAAAWHVEDGAAAVYYMLHALQHRGSDGAGVASADGQVVHCLKGKGMLSELLDQDRLEGLPGENAIGMVQMGDGQDVGPIRVRSHQGPFALVTTGCISNAETLRREMEAEGLLFQGDSDAEVLAHLVQKGTGTLAEKVEHAIHQVKGAYAFCLMTKNSMYVYVSGAGIHPLWVAQYQEGYLIASETAAFSMFDTGKTGQLKPGQLLHFGKDGRVSTRPLDLPRPCPCAMEAVYYSREDSVFEGVSVHKIRQRFGEMLARDEEAEADLVIGVPDTALASAAAMARCLDLPYELGLIKNRYMGSTFIRPSRDQREQGMKVRLNAISSVVKGKRVLLVDDSLQKGITAKRLCQMLKEAGAREVHLRIACPRIAFPCVYGMESLEQRELASSIYTDEELAQLFGADSIRFLEKADFEKVLPAISCLACMDGRYPEDAGDLKDRTGGEAHV